MTQFSETHRQVLATVCDTFVPAVKREPDPDGFLRPQGQRRRRAAGLEQMLSEMPDEQRAGLLGLLDALAEQGFPRASQRSREQILRNVALTGPAAAAGVGALAALTLFLLLRAPRRARPEPELGDVRLSRARKPTAGGGRDRYSRSPSTATRRSRPTSASSALAPAAA